MNRRKGRVSSVGVAVASAHCMRAERRRICADGAGRLRFSPVRFRQPAATALSPLRPANWSPRSSGRSGCRYGESLRRRSHASLHTALRVAQDAHASRYCRKSRAGPCHDRRDAEQDRINKLGLVGRAMGPGGSPAASPAAPSQELAGPGPTALPHSSPGTRKHAMPLLLKYLAGADGRPVVFPADIAPAKLPRPLPTPPNLSDEDCEDCRHGSSVGRRRRRYMPRYFCSECSS
ncbi:hypothetical protein EJ04DRAFT_251273 [Polyplosphaeria fusca]|uniref:Uncharacterized protein n=1 Tax=Polyplosphaeria fusca TaxID=682080 RepID=A0A9P4QUY0_9PLEO|nr:hypothetical protein EJ04DRAFT_251273 [Polyplosphaeria fusca]